MKTATTILNLQKYRWWNNPPPEEVLKDREALLKYELSLIMRAYQEECDPIIKQLSEIEMMKPPQPFIINFDQLSSNQQDYIKSQIDRIKP